jgi:hypothetical protein
MYWSIQFLEILKWIIFVTTKSIGKKCNTEMYGCSITRQFCKCLLSNKENGPSDTRCCYHCGNKRMVQCCRRRSPTTFSWCHGFGMQEKVSNVSKKIFCIQCTFIRQTNQNTYKMTCDSKINLLSFIQKYHVHRSIAFN